MQLSGSLSFKKKKTDINNNYKSFINIAYIVIFPLQKRAKRKQLYFLEFKREKNDWDLHEIIEY